MRAIIAMGQEEGALTRRVLRAACCAFLAAGIMAISYSGYAVLDRYLYQSVETSEFERVIVTGSSARCAMSGRET